MTPSPSEDLIQTIKQAFADVSYPGDDNLTDSPYGDEPAALVEDFKGKTDWHGLDATFLDQAPDGWSSALSFFSDAALQFYLPAYLIADLNGELMHCDPSFRLCYGVTPQAKTQKIAKIWGGGTLADYARQDFARFTDEQVLAIVAYLWWKLESEPHNLVVEHALEAYWLERVHLPSPPPNADDR
jgi:hypothetical protein